MTSALISVPTNAQSLSATAATAPAQSPAQVPSRTSTIDSIDTLYSLYSQRIFRFLLTALRDRDLAESLTQDTFIRAWSARDQFRGDCAPATWLTRIALNLVRDHTRTNRFRFWKKVAGTAVDAHEFAGFIPDQATSAESSLIARQQVEHLWQTVETLTERQRTVFILRFVEELDLATIAEITNMPISTVKTHLYRGLAAIRAQQPALARAHGKDSK
jgi:RNA polymerase sigma-70 factor (ECF subfamily)